MSHPTDPEAQRLAGEILVLDRKGRKGRTPAERVRYRELLERFDDHEESTPSLVRAVGEDQGR